MVVEWTERVGWMERGPALLPPPALSPSVEGVPYPSQREKLMPDF